MLINYTKHHSLPAELGLFQDINILMGAYYNLVKTYTNLIQ